MRVGIERAHIEEDTGKNTHVGGDGRIHGAEYSLVDYNRAGVPLVEIVSEPDLRSTDDARAYVTELREILARHRGLRRQDGGGLDARRRQRVGAAGGRRDFGTRCEIKNLNSIRSLVRAIDYEARRQVELFDGGERVVQETRHWDEDDGRTQRAAAPRRRPRTTGTSPSPISCPSSPTPSGSRPCRDGQPAAARRTAAASLAAAAGVEPTDAAVALAVDRSLDELALAAIDAGADPARVLTHVQHNLAVAGADRLDPERFARAGRHGDRRASSPPPRPSWCWPSW